MNASVLFDKNFSSRDEFLAGSGEMEQRIRAYDWKSTPLGHPDTWPQSLKTIVRVMLDSRYAMWMLWGPELTFFCNDAYLPTVGIKRDWVLGARSDKVWEEIWPDIGPRISQVLAGGRATWDEALLLFLERSGFPEETYHTFSYSPVYDDANRIAGMLCVVTEVTERVIGERQLRVLRDLAESKLVESVEESCRRACEVLARYPLEIPFAALYLFDPTNERVVRAASTGLSAERALPEFMAADSNSPWPIDALLKVGTWQAVTDIERAGIRIAAEPWPDLVQRVLLLPLSVSAQQRPAGFLVVGTSPRRHFNATYRDFLGLVAGQVASSLAGAQAYEAERKRVQALAELDHAKTAFFSNVSHEFRTPLTLILGPLNEALDSADLPAKSRDQLALAQRNSLRLLKLVNSLLDFSRIEAGRVQATYEPTDLAAFTRDLASTFRSAIERAGLHFDVQCHDLDEPVYVDREMWEKIVLNLLSNAFKFTLEGTIAVNLHRESDTAVLRVIDTGTGIPEHELPKLFERFHRVHGARGRTHEGSGIGLALVQELVKLHGARIDVSSQTDVGTTFSVIVPLGSAHLIADRVISSEKSSVQARNAQAFVEEAVRWIPDDDLDVVANTSDVATRSNFDARFASTYGARIILADDNADMRSYVRELLTPLYEVEAVADGEEALAAARRKIPQLIVSDVMMPMLDGFGLLKRLRREDELRDIPVVLLSARAGEEARIEGLDAGADDYLIKPFSARELLARIGALLELTQMRAENELRLRLALSSIQDQFFMLDDALRYVLANPRVSELSGVKEADLLGRSVFEVLPHLKGTLFETELRTAISTTLPRRFEMHDETTGRWLESAIYPAERGVAILGTDITERKQAQEAARLRTAQFETLLTEAPLGVYLVDADFCIREVNPIAKGVFGDIDPLIGQEFDKVIRVLWPTEFAEELIRLFQRTLETGESYVNPEKIHERKDSGIIESYAWQIHRIPQPDGRYGVVCYFRDISSQIKARTELLEQQHRLEEADRLKDQFLAMLAHELRNPLAPIRNAGEMLNRVLPPDSKAQPAAGIIKRQVTQLTRLVDDLLDVSRITRGRIDLKITSVDLRHVLTQAMETVEPHIREKQHRVAITSSYQESLLVDGDFARLVQCVVNIITNAAKYTDTGGEIRIHSGSENGLASIEVADNGIGISPELLPRVFDLFVQSDRTLDRAQGGLGIGLSVVKGLIEMHGGDVLASSDGLGRGSTFIFRLPLAAQRAEIRSIESATHIQAQRVLIVDDNRDAANSLAELLKLDGHTVEVVYSGAHALRQLGVFRPQIILLDIGLPEMNGYEVAKRIRALPALSGVQLIALTGYGQADDRKRSADAGFDDHLVKPVDSTALMTSLERAVQRSR